MLYLVGSVFVNLRQLAVCSLRHQNNQDLNRMRFDEVWLPVKPNHLQSLIVLISDLKMRLSPNGDMKNETNRIQLLTLTWIYVKTGWWMMIWMTKAILLAMIVEKILIIFIVKGMPCRSSHPWSSQYASFNAIYTNWFISTPRCNLL